jgi:hypothetical protein
MCPLGHGRGIGAKMYKLFLIWAFFSFYSCNGCGVSGDNKDAYDADVHELAELGEDGGGETDAADAEADGPFIDAPSDAPPELENCFIPVMDCGEGCVQLTCMASVLSQFDVDPDGKKLVYVGLRRGESPPYALYFKDIERWEEIKIKDIPGYSPLYDVSFYYSYACYRWDNDDESDLQVKIDCTNVETSESFTVAEGNANGTPMCPDIFGNIVVWAGNQVEPPPAFHYDLYLFNIETMEKTRLTFDRNGNYSPSIWGNCIVHERDIGGEEANGIWLFDVDTAERRNLTNHPADQFQSYIWENRVVWTDCRNSSSSGLCYLYNERNSDTYWCDLPDCIAMQATDNPAAQEHPTVEGDIVAWYDYRNDVLPNGVGYSYHDNIEIWGKNLRTGEEKQLAGYNRILGQKIRIAGGKLFFLMDSDTSLSPYSGAVFMKDLPF